MEESYAPTGQGVHPAEVAGLRGALNAGSEASITMAAIVLRS